MSLTREKSEMKEATGLNIAKLSDLVKSNQFDDIKKIVSQAKAILSWKWYLSDQCYVECAMRDAILLGQIDTVRFFLDEGISPNAFPYTKGNAGCLSSLISFAAESGNLDIVKLLVSHGANIKPYNSYYHTGDDSAIRASVKASHADIVAYLLENGAKAEGLCGGGTLGEAYGGTTFLAKAAENGDTRIVELLLKYGASIQSSLYLAHEKFKHYYGQYVSAIAREYNENRRRSKIEYGFDLPSEFYHHYELKPEVKEFLDQQNKALHHLDAISELDKNKIIEEFNLFFKIYSIDLTREKVSKKSESLIKTLQEFDQKKQQLEIKRDKIKNSYERTVKTLLDYAAGIDFPIEKTGSFCEEYDGLSFLKEIDISGYHFVGCSIKGQPITREMLIERKLNGADKALVSINDLTSLEDSVHREALTMKLENRIKERGSLISPSGIVNLVPLWRAAEIGDMTAVITRLKAGVNPNEGEDKDHIPIVLSAKKGHVDIVKILVEHVAIDKKSIVEAIEAARGKKHDEIAAYLFEQQDINAVDEKGDTLLHKAVKQIDVERVQVLIKKGANINLKNKNRETPLLIAASFASKNGAEIVDILLKNGADANQYDWKSPLSHAIKKGNYESAVLLLPHTEKRELIRRSGWDGKEKGRDPWYVDLMFDALRRNNIEILSLLKTNGSDFNSKNEYGDTLLNQAVRLLPSFSDIIRTVRDMARSGYNRFPGTMNNTVDDLIDTSKEDFKKAFKLINFLLDHGADSSLGDKNSYTPLHFLIKDTDLRNIEEGYKQILELFVQRGANVNARTQGGLTPLHEAADVGDLIAIEFLVKHGADIHATTHESKWTPLHQAAVRGFVRTSELLIKLGADVNARDADGLTPLELCKKSQLNNKKGYQFSDNRAEREFDEPYLKTQRLLSLNASTDKNAMTELVRQRQTLLDAGSVSNNHDEVTHVFRTNSLS